MPHEELTLGDTLVAGEEYSPSAIAASSERRRILRRSIENLSGRQTLLVILRYDEGLTYLEIAAVFRVSEVAVFKMHQRVLRILHGVLVEAGIRRLNQIL